MVRGPNPIREAISSGPQKHFINTEKNWRFANKFVDLVECNIFPNSDITYCKTATWMPLGYVLLRSRLP